jgi:cell division protein FtsB
MAQTTATHRFEQASSPSTANRLLVWFSIGALLLSLPLLFNVVTRLQSESRMQAEVDRISQQVSASEARLAGLRNALDYAKSDAYVEQWARARARWGRDGEVVVVPPASGDASRLWWEDFLK